jgi:hypothetical protein
MRCNEVVWLNPCNPVAKSKGFRVYTCTMDLDEGSGVDYANYTAKTRHQAQGNVCSTSRCC